MLSVVLRRAVLAAALCVSLSPSAARADEAPFVVVERTAGEPLRGRLLDLTGRKFRLQLADGSVVEVPEAQVREVRFEAPAAPAAPEHPYRVIHGAPTASITTEPGTVQVNFAPSSDNEYVMASTELWRRAGDGPWSQVKALPPGGPGVFEDTPPDPRAAYTYKVVSVGDADGESPVVQRYRLALPADEARKESQLLGPVTPGARFHVVPVAIYADGSAQVVVHAWTRHPELPARSWWSKEYRTLPGAPVGGVVDGLDLNTGATLESARVETKGAGPARLVVRLRHADGRVEEVDGTTALPNAITYDTPRGVVSSSPALPAPRDRAAEVRAALVSQRPLTLTFPLETPLRDVLPLLRDLTGVDIVASPNIDQDQATVRFDVRSVPQAELLTLALEMMGLEARPWCGVLWLDVRGAGERWVRPTAPGPAGALLEQARVSLELSRFPLRDALDLLRAQTGLNIVLSGGAQDWIDDESVTTTVAARDVSLRDALSLIVDGTDVLHWHARGSVVQVLTWSERPTREVLLEQLLCGIATGDTRLIRAATGVQMDDEGSGGVAMAELARKVLALGAELRPLTAEKLSRALRLEPGAGGDWNLVGLAEPEPKAILDAATAAQTWEVTVDRDDPTRFTAFALERREAMPVTDLRALTTSDADLWIEAKAGLFGALGPGALGLELRDSQAAIAEITSSLAQLLAKPGEIEWRQQLSFEKLDGDRELLVRTRSGRLFHAHANLGRFGGKSTFRFTPLAQSHSHAAVREATALADAGDVVAAIATLDRFLASNLRDLEALLLRAQLRLTRGDRAGANLDAQQVLSMVPDHALALTITAYALREDDHARRLELCTAALRSDPTLVRALVLRADTNAALGRRDEALQDIRKARQLAPEDIAVWIASARVAYFMDDLDGAFSMASKAVDLDPRNPRALYAMAKILEARGDLDRALRSFEVALERARESDPDAVAAVQKDIEALRARVEAARSPSQPSPKTTTTTAWVVTIDAATHGEQALIWLKTQQVSRESPAIVHGADLWVDPAGPALGVPRQLLTTSLPGPAIAPLPGDASPPAWTDRIAGESLVTGFRFLVRTESGQLFVGVVQRRAEGVLELMFAPRP